MGGSNTGGAPILPHLLNQIPRDQEIGSVTAGWRIRYAAMSQRHPLPVPSLGTTRLTRINISGPRALTELERPPSKKPRRDKPSRGIAPQCLAGQRMARDFDRQVAEVQVRVAILNGYTALGISVTKVVG